MYDFCVLQIAEIPGITKKNAMPAMALVANLHQSIAMVTVWLCVWDYNFFFHIVALPLNTNILERIGSCVFDSSLKCLKLKAKMQRNDIAL